MPRDVQKTKKFETLRKHVKTQPQNQSSEEKQNFSYAFFVNFFYNNQIYSVYNKRFHCFSGRKRRSESRLLETLLNQSEEDQGDIRDDRIETNNYPDLLFEYK